METKTNSNIVNKETSSIIDIEDTLSSCSKTLSMMSYMFMESQFECDEDATYGVHDQLLTIKSKLDSCNQLLSSQRAQEAKLN